MCDCAIIMMELTSNLVQQHIPPFANIFSIAIFEYCILSICTYYTEPKLEAFTSFTFRLRCFNSTYPPLFTRKLIYWQLITADLSKVRRRSPRQRCIRLVQNKSYSCYVAKIAGNRIKQLVT
ncbi:Hypothetical_protein [Hexamita inflata]|uniref:Hypothetical_protein n=1 Tax=Hexamita inflata TaxID=28002 RepID=A0AA86UG96_9EUKA|nr:Hypothetical protein HINF_LOCUS37637 [Hexamita inflata]